MNGYSIYVHLDPDGVHHTVRLYRDIDDKHLHSWENCESLDVTMAAVSAEIRADERNG